MAEGFSSACLVIPNLPAGAFCGIDLLSFTTSPRFRGIRQLPRGWHVVFTGVNSIFSIRHGSWFLVKDDDRNSADLFVKNWDASKEELIAETDPASLLSWRANLGSIWHDGLTPYRQSASGDVRKEGRGFTEESADWETLTDCISEELLARVTGPSPVRDNWTLTSASSAKQDADSIPGLSKEESAIHPERELGFLPIDLKQTWRQGAVGRERTIAAQDRSWALRNLVANYCKQPMEVIGELQFSFLMVLTLNNYSCFEQWKRLLSIMLTCQEAVAESPELFTKLLSTLHLQLCHCQDAEGGLFDLSDEGGALLKMLLRKFRQGLQPLSFEAKEDVIDELDDLEEYLKAEYGWIINDLTSTGGMLRLEDGEEVWMDMKGAEDEDERGDYLPVVVDLTPDQAEQLRMQAGSNISFRSGDSLRRKERLSSVSSTEKEQTSEVEDMEPIDMDARF